jgi:hypothetical protein
VHGDLGLRFDRDAYSPVQRQRDRVDTARLGVRRDFGPDSTLLGSFIYERSEQNVVIPPPYEIDGDLSSYSIDARHILSREHWTLNTGAQAFRNNENETRAFRFPSGTPALDLVEDVGRST